MTDIHRIDAYIATANISGAGTDGIVYLGLAGREFLINSADSTNDFERGSERTYTLGEEGNTSDPQANDPRHPQLTTDDLITHPAYLRLVPAGIGPAWALDRITVTVNPGPGQQIYDNLSLAGTDNVLWLGPSSGEYLYLTPTP